jgi:histidyl-tRNA synthetase
VILGDDELARGVATVKPLRETTEQHQVPLDELPAALAAAGIAGDRAAP